MNKDNFFHDRHLIHKHGLSRTTMCPVSIVLPVIPTPSSVVGCHAFAVSPSTEPAGVTKWGVLKLTYV
ncbi:MAG: hypothetical protein ABIK92_16220 [Pseudomonadota bacterium]